MKLHKTLVIALVAGLFLAGCVRHIGAENILIPRTGNALVSGPSADGHWQLTALSLPRDDGAVLRGIHAQKSDAQATVLYFGGNGMTLERNINYLLRIYRDLPVNVIAFDHRGYGGSSGDASLDALYADGRAIFAYAQQAALSKDQPLIVHGHSLGSFIAGEVAANAQLDGLVLESSATSSEDWAALMRANAPWYVRFLVRLKLKPELQGQGNARHMASLDEPVLFVVGQNDTVTRPEMSRQLFAQAALAGDDKELLEALGANHLNAALGAEYHAAFLRLLDKAKHKNAVP